MKKKLEKILFNFTKVLMWVEIISSLTFLFSAIIDNYVAINLEIVGIYAGTICAIVFFSFLLLGSIFGAEAEEESVLPFIDFNK